MANRLIIKASRVFLLAPVAILVECDTSSKPKSYIPLSTEQQSCIKDYGKQIFDAEIKFAEDYELLLQAENTFVNSVLMQRRALEELCLAQAECYSPDQSKINFAFEECLDPGPYVDSNF